MNSDISPRLLSLMQQANQIASATDLDTLLQQTLAFLLNICAAPAGTLYLDERAEPLTGAENQSSAVQLTLKAICGSDTPAALLNRQVYLEEGPLQIALASQQIQRASLTPATPLQNNFCPLDEFNGRAFVRVLSLPLLAGAQGIGVVQVFDYDPQTEALLVLFASRMVSEIHKAMQIGLQERFVERLKALIEFIGMIGSSLDRDQILRMIIDNASELLHSQASSLFLMDDETGESVLKIASNVDDLPIEEIRVPPGKGIIGAAIQTGKPVHTSDISHDNRHYGGVDKGSGFVTHSVLAVPLRTRPVALGEELGTTEARIIGALEAINKAGGEFDEYDTELLKTLANQAATVLKIAELYTNANELYMDIIKALAAAIDAKDPYTVGHSQRVSNFAVEIAHQMGLAPDVIQQIRIGALLHDVGKIGIPDSILLKPGRLTTDEYTWMKKHPTVGENIMNQVRMLHTALPCLSEHHEKIDGSGYPRGLYGSQISLMGRIVAVADVFDAVTSDRPYRPGMTIDEAFSIQKEASGTHFDGECVEALMQAYRAGKIQAYHPLAPTPT